MWWFGVNYLFEYRKQWRGVVHMLIHFLVLQNARNFLANWLTVDSQNVIQSLLVSYSVTYLLCHLLCYFVTYSLWYLLCYVLYYLLFYLYFYFLTLLLNQTFQKLHILGVNDMRVIPLYNFNFRWFKIRRFGGWICFRLQKLYF